MADDLAAILSDPALLALVLERQRLARPEVGAGESGLPSMPPLPIEKSSEGERAVAAMGLPAGAAPYVDALLTAEPYTREFTGIPQADRASTSIADLLADPSLATATNAGVQTALAVGRPMAALGALGGGLTAAGLQDVGMPGVGEAAAAERLNRAQRREETMKDNEAKRQSDAAARAAELKARLEREAADAAAKRDLETKAKSDTQAEYNRAVARSEDAYKREMDRDWRFDESNVGQVWRSTGGLGPALVGFGLGKLSRAASGPGEKTLGKVLKDYVAPTVVGGAGGAISANLPLVGEALYAPAYNPKKAAYEARAEELPPNHPRRNEYLEYAKSLPEKNPVRTNAADEFYNTEKLKERMGIGALEGASGGLAASDLINALARMGRGVGERLGVIASRQQSTPPAGTVIDAAPSSSMMARGGEDAMARILSEGKALPPPPASSPSSAASVVTRVKTKDGRVTYHGEDGKYTSPPPKKGKQAIVGDE